MWFTAVLAGALLGVLSRVEERVPGFYLAISTNATWLTAAFATGLLARRPARAARLGPLTLTAANAAYYAWIALTEPDRELSSVSGPLLPWFAAGIGAGLVFGLAGALARTAAPPLRAAAALTLALAIAGAFDRFAP